MTKGQKLNERFNKRMDLWLAQRSSNHARASAH